MVTHIVYAVDGSLARLLRAALPDTIVHDDCSMELNGPIEGWSGRGLLRLEWPECPCRVLKVDGLSITATCLLHDKQLTIADCKNCTNPFSKMPSPPRK